jgi:HlyD family secretion protein
MSLMPNRSPLRARLGLAFCALLATPACSPPAEPKPAPAIQTVTVGLIGQRVLDAQLKASGLLVSREELLVSTELSGYRVAKVLVDQGEQVRGGQAVAVLDDSLLRNQVAQQQAIVDQQQVAAERAEQEAARVKGLDAAGALSGEAVAERVLAARAARAALAQARAALADLRVRQAMMVVRAPQAGRILERIVRPGDVVSPGQALFRAARDGLVELDAEVPENRLDSVAVGAPVSVTLASGAQLAGRVRLVSPQVDMDTKLGRIRVCLPAREDLRPGAFAEAVMTLAPREATVAPVEAVQYSADGPSLLIVDGQDRVARRAVRTGPRVGRFVEILDGAPLGAKVVLRGGAILLPGDRVKPVFKAGAAQ